MLALDMPAHLPDRAMAAGADAGADALAQSITLTAEPFGISEERPALGLRLRQLRVQRRRAITLEFERFVLADAGVPPGVAVRAPHRRRLALFARRLEQRVRCSHHHSAARADAGLEVGVAREGLARGSMHAHPWNVSRG